MATSKGGVLGGPLGSVGGRFPQAPLGVVTSTPGRAWNSILGLT